MKNQITHSKSLIHAVTAVFAAWKKIHHYFQSEELDVVQKSDGPATVADRLADQSIIETLTKLDPEAGFLTEESENNKERLRKKRVWIIDPIDGTTEFMKGSPEFAMHVASVVRDGDNSGSKWELEAGIVFIPVTGELFFAQKGYGAYLKNFNPEDIISRDFEAQDIADYLSNATKQMVTDAAKIDESTVVVSKSNSTQRLNKAINSVPFGKVMRKGSLGVKVMEVVRGEADLYLHTETNLCKEWDLCAPQIILEEAGGFVTQLNQDRPVYNKPKVESMQGVVASNQSCHENVIKALDGVI